MLEPKAIKYVVIEVNSDVPRGPLEATNETVELNGENNLDVEAQKR